MLTHCYVVSRMFSVVNWLLRVSEFVCFLVHDYSTRLLGVLGSC